MNPAYNIVLIGCGKMGSALLQSWIDARIDAQFSVIDPHDIPFKGIDHYRDTIEAEKALKSAHAVILAVKPQVMAGICGSVTDRLPETTLVLSIAAGQSLSALEGYFSPAQPIIRAMPNMPAAIGKGVTVAIKNGDFGDTLIALAETLMRCAGKFEWIDDEGLMDAVTAISGSGPAYIFYLIEALIVAGKEAGLPTRIAQTLARQTVIGSAALAEDASDTSAETLRKNVTSTGGTTAAALDKLMDGRFQDVLNEAVTAAAKRSKELNG